MIKYSLRQQFEGRIFQTKINLPNVKHLTLLPAAIPANRKRYGIQVRQKGIAEIMKEFFRRVMLPACVYFTVLTFIYAAVIYALYGGSEDGGLLSSLRTLLFFVFSLLFASANGLLGVKKLPFGVRLLSHAVLTGFGFWLCLLMPAEIRGSATLIGMVIFYIIYAAVAALVMLIRSQTRKKENKEAQYTAVYAKRDDRKE